jgi:Skp family chaperone for outer membrane proteins
VKRVFGYLSALAAFGGMLSVASAQPPATTGAPPPAGTTVRPTIAVFNMAAVMRDYDKAKYQVYLLNKMKIERSASKDKLRAEMIRLNQVLQGTQDPTTKSKLEKDMMEYQHKYQVEERDVNKFLNDEASKIISKLYDEIKLVVDKTADMNAYHIVFAYPDGVTPEDHASPFLKELKLKPPAAMPFYVSKQVDITGIVVQTLNAWYPPTDERGQKVDMAKLPPLEPPAAPGTATPGAAPTAPGGPTAGVPATGVPTGAVPGRTGK